jgi:hypothetical protein
MVKIEVVLHPKEAELVWAMLNHCRDAARTGEFPAWCRRFRGIARGAGSPGAGATPSPEDVETCGSDDSAESRVAVQGTGVAVTPRLPDAAAGGSDDSAESGVAAQEIEVAVTQTRSDAAACRSDDSAESRDVPAAQGARAAASPDVIETCESGDSAELRGVIVPHARSEVATCKARSTPARSPSAAS